MATKSKVSTEEWIEELKGISVLELSERIKALEEEFGVRGRRRCGRGAGHVRRGPHGPRR
jgi:ribosomal protein L7/L12